MLAPLKELAAKHPRSPWRLESVLSAANSYLIDNRSADYLPLYKTCADAFPGAEKAAPCQWKVAWNAYITGKSNALALLREHVERYPASEKAAAARYFAGRLLQRAGKNTAATTLYEEIESRFPNSWYATLARERLGKAVSVQYTASAPSFIPTPESRLRIERARLLVQAGMADMAEVELKFGAKTDTQPQVAAIELARIMSEQGEYARALRYIKSLTAGYLAWPIESGPGEFWRFAFPLPWRSALESNSRLRSLDPFTVAALIRQESEFDPNAISRARAYGLTQILPSTGRELSRRVGMPQFSNSMLFDPEVSLQLGTYNLQQLLDEYDGRWEVALAAYNAGKGRANRWLTWGTFNEPAEFVETVPFTETRTYIQAVLRNADIYRRLYGRGASTVTSGDGAKAFGSTRGN
jgi:soluble lytic murein transglycosylase